MENKRVFYLATGIAVDKKPDKDIFYIQENLNEDHYYSKYYYEGDNILYDLDALCVDLYDVFQNKVFDTPEEYYQHIHIVPQGLVSAGLDSDIALPKEMYEKYFKDGVFSELLKESSLNEEQRMAFNNVERLKYHYAYTADCQSLINTLQELILSTNNSFIGFYKLLCTVPGADDFEENYYAISPDGRLAFNMLYSLIIQVYSIFDIVTKIAFELENLKVCAGKYERLASKGILYGDRNKLRMSPVGTLFERSRATSIFENLRNEIVHNATWEMNPKVFFKCKDGVITERTIYMPDFTEEGTLVSYKNRKRFFASGKKVNEELPLLYFEILNRLSNTIDKLLRI